MELKSLFLLLCFGLVQHLTAAVNLGIARGKNTCVPANRACLSRGVLCIGGMLTADGIDPTPNRYRHWSAAHHFTQDEATLKAALPGMARQAYEEMIADAQNQGIEPADRPSVMAALLVGTDIYFSSSVKGGPFLLEPWGGGQIVQSGVAEEVALAVVRCQTVYNGEHNYGT